jgi:hypothetical protein
MECKMKAFGLISILVLLAGNISSQNITNTLGVSGLFTIKDGTSTYLSLNQNTGYLSINRSITLPMTTGSTLGIIYKDNNRFIHNYAPPGSTGHNTFVGVNSGNFTMTAPGSSNSSYNTGVGFQTLFSNTVGYRNTAIGYNSLGSNTFGYDNTAVGYFSLHNNSTGTENSAFGTFSLSSNTGYYNAAFGYASLTSNTDGSRNSAFGYQSLYSNVSSDKNSAFGYQSLYSNNTGIENSSFGYQSLFSSTSGHYNSAFGYLSMTSNQTGNWNSAFGYESLKNNTIGVSNTAFGYQSLYNNISGGGNAVFGNYAGNTITTGSNNIAIGINAQVPSGTSSNQVRIGSTFVIYAGIQVAWTITSDRRWKSNITDSKLGLDFINRLRPVSYFRTNDESKKTEFGFIAQEVEETLISSGVSNSGMLTIDDEGTYNMRYNDLIAPMVKAIQELKEENDKLRIEIETLKDIKQRLSRLEETSGAEKYSGRKIESVEK